MQEETPSQLDFFEDIDDDEEPVDLKDVTSAVVTDTDWTTETILSQMKRGNIQLNPRFQRRDAWDRSRKSRFIESLLLGLPIPQIVLAADKARRGSFIVLDGKQRLLTLSQFAKGSSLDPMPDGDIATLRLSALEVRKDLQRKNLADLEESAELIEDLDTFLNQTVRTVVVRNWPDDDFLNLVFLRLNTGSVRLSPQELRQALHPGPFTDFLDDHASRSEPLQAALNIRGPDFRMRDVELLLRHFALKENLSEYKGNLKKFLDDASDLLNRQWESGPDKKGKIETEALEFDDAISATLEIFGQDAFSRWNPDRQAYERRFNRAVFDVMTFYFSDPEIRATAISRSVEVRAMFEEISNERPAFVESMQTSTKTIEALHTRLSTWGKGLLAVTGLEFEVPILDLDRTIRMN